MNSKPWRSLSKCRQRRRREEETFCLHVFDCCSCLRDRSGNQKGWFHIGRRGKAGLIPKPSGGVKNDVRLPGRSAAKTSGSMETSLKRSAEQTQPMPQGC